MRKITLLSFVLFITNIFAQEVPKSYSNIKYNEKGELILNISGKEIKAEPKKSRFKYSDIVINPESNERGLVFNFKKKFNGTLYYGFIKYNDGKYNYPVFFKKPARIIDGTATIDIKRLSGKYDMIDWEQKEKGTVGYRVCDDKGYIIYDGVINFKGTSPFYPAPTIIEGPFISKIKPDKATIWFKTNYKIKTRIDCNTNQWKDDSAKFVHIFKIDELTPNTRYSYTIHCDDFEYRYNFKTALEKGSDKSFTFAYASDSRVGQGGGERNIYGVNAYILKRIMATASNEGVSFIQFTGDLVNGYVSSADEINLEYTNWKKAIEPFAHYLPVYIAPGNHESLTYNFYVQQNHYPIAVDRFPFDKESGEAVFANNFVLPENGPVSEDDSKYDPSPKTIDFPSYKETAYYYTYGNTGFIVLNSNYWYAPQESNIPVTSGNVHAYIMENQMKWYENTLNKMEKDSKIKNIFVTIHTPAFPNGGHSHNDMWYKGNNEIRPYIAGKAVDKGIIEMRDEFLDLTINKTTKVKALLTGDEHNYCKLYINDKMERYPKNYTHNKLKLNRAIYQINNGAAGAPYYAQEVLPWSKYTSGFTTQNAVVLITVNGENIHVKAVNPDTLDIIEEYDL